MTYVNSNFCKAEIEKLDSLKWDLKTKSRENTIKAILKEYWKIKQADDRQE